MGTCGTDSYRDVEELLAEREIEVDHVSVYRWVQRFTPLFGRLIPTAAHVTEQYANNPVESDHARLKARLRPMRGLKQFRSAGRLAAGHELVQNLRRGHYELATDVLPPLRPATVSSELALAR